MHNLVLLTGRILASAIFIQAGYSELVNLDGTVDYFEDLGIPWPDLLVWPAVGLELVGGIMVLIGLFTRPFAAALSAFTMFAAFTGHADFTSFTEFQFFMKDVAIAGGYLFLAACGPGEWSLDARLSPNIA